MDIKGKLSLKSQHVLTFFRNKTFQTWQWLYYTPCSVATKQLNTDTKWNQTLKNMYFGNTMEWRLNIHLWRQKSGSPDGVAESNGERSLLEYEAPHTLCFDEKPAIDASFLTTDTGLLDIFDIPFCIFVAAGFDDFLYIRIDRGLDIFAIRMSTQLESVYFGAVLCDLPSQWRHRVVYGQPWYHTLSISVVRGEQSGQETWI